MHLILILPIALVILDLLLPWIDKIINLKEETKLLIGRIVIWGAVIGTVLLVLGILALGIAGLILVFGGLFLAVANFLGLFLPKPFAGIGASLLALGIPIDLVKKAWNLLKSTVSGVFVRIKEKLAEHGIDVDAIWAKVKEKISGNEGVMGLWTDLKDFFVNTFQPKWDDFMTSLDTISEVMPSVNTAISALATALKAVADELVRIKDNPLPAIIGAALGARFGPFGAAVGAVGGARVGEAVNQFGTRIEESRQGPLAGQLPPTELNITIGGTITAGTPIDEAGLFQRIGDFITRHVTNLWKGQ